MFDDLSLQIRSGQNTAILGPNGAGKTTLLKLLTRELYPVHRPDSHVRVLGRDRWNVWELRAHLGIVSNDLQHEYTGDVRGIDVVLSGYYSSIGTYSYQEFEPAVVERARGIMRWLGVADLSEKRYATLSTGQQRRLLLGRALVRDPATLVLDEPTSGLDLKATFQYLAAVRELMRRNKTVVLVTHHIHEIPPEVDHVILLKQGRVVAQGAKAEVLADRSLSELFEIPVHLVAAHGYYQAVPAEQ